MPRQMTQEEKQALEGFPLAAREFCEFVEQSVPERRDTFARQLFTRLTRVCDVANHLPWVDPATADIEINQDEIRAGTDEYFNLSERLRRVFGNFDSYWDVFDPTAKREPLNGSLAQDVAEICRDLRGALALTSSGADLSDIHWQWRFDFRSHWGRHAGSALRMLLLLSDFP